MRLNLEQKSRLKEKGLLGDPNHEFKELLSGVREIVMRINPGDTVTYEPGAKSFKEFVEGVVEGGGL